MAKAEHGMTRGETGESGRVPPPIGTMVEMGETQGDRNRDAIYADGETVRSHNPMVRAARAARLTAYYADLVSLSGYVGACECPPTYETDKGKDRKNTHATCQADGCKCPSHALDALDLAMGAYADHHEAYTMASADTRPDGLNARPVSYSFGNSDDDDPMRRLARSMAKDGHVAAIAYLAREGDVKFQVRLRDLAREGNADARRFLRRMTTSPPPMLAPMPEVLAPHTCGPKQDGESWASYGARQRCLGCREASDRSGWDDVGAGLSPCIAMDTVIRGDVRSARGGGRKVAPQMGAGSASGRSALPRHPNAYLRG